MPDIMFSDFLQKRFKLYLATCQAYHFQFTDLAGDEKKRRADKYFEHKFAITSASAQNILCFKKSFLVQRRVENENTSINFSC